MNPRVQYLINHPFEVSLSDISVLQDEIEKYPYFATLRILLLYGLKNADHPEFERELKKTSIHAPSRVALYHYLKKEKQQKIEEADEIKEEISNVAEVETKEEPVIAHIPEEIEETNIQPEIDESSDNLITETADSETEEEKSDLEFFVNEIAEEEEADDTSEHTFMEWLNFSAEPAKKQEYKLSEKEIKFQLIDEFIEKSPKIPPADKSRVTEVKPAESTRTQEYSDLMTETLAEIYTEQRKYDKAIRAYRILSLKYPDKSNYFDRKINEIEALKDSK